MDGQHITSEQVATEPLESGGYPAEHGTAPALARPSSPAAQADPSLVSRVEVFRRVSSSIPNNDHGLPKFIYRPDLIPSDIFEMSDVDRAGYLEMASVEVHYLEGFPAFENGMSFWSQMPHEDAKDFSFFLMYLELAELKGIRNLQDVISVAEAKGMSHMIPRGDRRLEPLREKFIFNFWGARAKAYDFFKAAAAEKLRENRALALQDNHFLEAERLLQKIRPYFDETVTKTDEDGSKIEVLRILDEMTPKTALDYLEKLQKIQRVSVGLTAHGHANATEGSAPKNASTEVVLKTLHRESEDPNQAAAKDGSADLAMLLDDPETAKLAQELVIKVQHSND